MSMVQFCIISLKITPLKLLVNFPRDNELIYFRAVATARTSYKDRPKGRAKGGVSYVISNSDL